MVIPITSTVQDRRFGMPIEYAGQTYYLMFTYIRTVSSKRLSRKISRLNFDQFEKVLSGVAIFFRHGLGKNETPSSTDVSLAGDHLVGTDGESRSPRA